MKGLLLKDWYTAKKSCRSFLLILIAFAVASAFSENNVFVFYPIILASILPVTLISYDERSKWQYYADTMPYKRRDIVTVKYLVMLILLVSTVIIMGTVNLVKSFVNQEYQLMEIAAFAGNSLILGVLPASVMLPVIFKFGVEKGRLAYFITIGMVFGGVFAFSYLSANNRLADFISGSFHILIPVAAVLLFAFSWFLSIKFYEKREL